MKLFFYWKIILKIFKDIDNNLKFISISKLLNQRRYPFTTEYKENIDNKVRNLNYDKYNKISISNNYEDLKYQIPISFKNKSEFDDQCKRINNLKTNKDFIALFGF